jgi:hypothetical protein
MTNPPNHTHEWRLTDSRPLHGVEPPTTLKEWIYDYCHARKQTEHARDTPTD